MSKSYLQNPSFTYWKSGTYTVSLTVTNRDGRIQTKTKQMYIDTEVNLIIDDFMTPSDSLMVINQVPWQHSGDPNAVTGMDRQAASVIGGYRAVALQDVDGQTDNGATMLIGPTTGPNGLPIGTCIIDNGSEYSGLVTSRARLIYDGGFGLPQTNDLITNIGYYGTSLLHPNIANVIVKSLDGLITYELGRDYSLNSDSGIINIARDENGQLTGMLNQETLYHVYYDYYQPWIVDTAGLGSIDLTRNNIFNAIELDFALIDAEVMITITIWSNHGLSVSSVSYINTSLVDIWTDPQNPIGSGIVILPLSEWAIDPTDVSAIQVECTGPMGYRVWLTKIFMTNII